MHLVGSWDTLKRARSEIVGLRAQEKDTSKSKEERDAAAAELRNRQIELAKSHGFAINENGEIVKATLDLQHDEGVKMERDAVKSRDAFYQANASGLKTAANRLTKQQAAAFAVRDATIPMSAYMKQAAARWLPQIANFTNRILNWVSGGMGTTEKQKKEHELEKATAHHKDLMNQEVELEKELAALREKMGSASEAEQKVLKEQIGATNKELVKIRGAILTNESFIQALNNLTEGKGMFSDWTGEEIRSMAKVGAIGGFDPTKAEYRTVGKGGMIGAMDVRGFVEAQEKEIGRKLTTEELEKAGIVKIQDMKDFSKEGFRTLRKIFLESQPDARKKIREVEAGIEEKHRARIEKGKERLEKKGADAATIAAWVTAQEKSMQKAMKTEKMMALFEMMQEEMKGSLETAGLIEGQGAEANKLTKEESKKNLNVLKKKLPQETGKEMTKALEKQHKKEKLEKAKAILSELGITGGTGPGAARNFQRYAENLVKASEGTTKLSQVTALKMRQEITREGKTMKAGHYLKAAMGTPPAPGGGAAQGAAATNIEQLRQRLQAFSDAPDASPLTNRYLQILNTPQPAGLRRSFPFSASFPWAQGAAGGTAGL